MTNNFEALQKNENKSEAIDALVLQTMTMLEAAGLTVNEAMTFSLRLDNKLRKARNECFKPVLFAIPQSKPEEDDCNG